MDDKRTFLAIALAIAVLLAWTPLAEHMGWIQPQQRPAATQEATPAPAPAAQTAVAPASSLPVFTPSAGTDVKVEPRSIPPSSTPAAASSAPLR